ncbi:uncharacterized protein LOC116027052 [Ipomoea triloba]|uniref:uncharacterized protein LOC116027052 n=1 Tax=Ipomoea triloba TaxID=35885 RepID=UPI00125DC20B|nr:uncharacterized protein LOC116027052 [Ipomoea triloba]
MAKGHGSEGSTHQPKTQPEPSKPKASKHDKFSKRTESSSEEEPEKSSKKRKAGSLEAAQKKKLKKHKSKRSKSSDEKDPTEVSEGRKTEGKQAESSHVEEVKASKEVTKKRKAKQLKRPKKKQMTDQVDEGEVEHETRSTAVLPAEEEPREAQLEECHRVLPPPLDLSREDTDEEDQMPLTRLLKPTTPQIESPSVPSVLESLPPPEPLVTEPESPIAPMPRTQQLVITLPRERNESGFESTMIEDESEGDDTEVCDQSYRPMSAIVQRQITEHLSPSMAHIMLALDYIHRHLFLQWPRVSTIRIEEIPPATTESEIPESAQQLILHPDSITQQINADAALAQQLAYEESEAEIPPAEAFIAESSHEDILRQELARVYNWQRWQMSSLRVIASTISEMAEEEEWALDWMGTRSIFDATRPDEIERVFAEKLQGRTTRFGKTVVLNVGYRTPRERLMLEDMQIAKIHNISRAQTEIRDLKPDVGPSRQQDEDDAEDSDSNQNQGCRDQHHKKDDDDDDNDDPSGSHAPSSRAVNLPNTRVHTTCANDESNQNHTDEPRSAPTESMEAQILLSPSSARDETMEASRGANHDGLQILDETMVTSDLNLVDVEVEVFPDYTSDGNLEASKSASPENLPSPIDDLNLAESQELVLVEGENMEAPSKDSHGPSADSSKCSDSSEVILDTSSAFTSLLNAIQGLARTQDSQFKSLNESITKIKKDVRRQKKKSSKSTIDERLTALEKKIDTAFSENLISLGSLKDSVTEIKKIQRDLVTKHAFIKERLDLSYSKLETVSESQNATASLVCEFEWTLKELQVCINRLSNKVDILIEVNDANKGEEMKGTPLNTCKGKEIVLRNDDQDNDDISRQRKAILNLRKTPSLSPSPKRTQDKPTSGEPSSKRQKKQGKEPKPMNRRVNGEPIEYVPYKEGSGKKWEECNIPPFWNKKQPMDRMNFLRDHNERIFKQRKRDEEIFRIQ